MPEIPLLRLTFIPKVLWNAHTGTNIIVWNDESQVVMPVEGNIATVH